MSYLEYDDELASITQEYERQVLEDAQSDAQYEAFINAKLAYDEVISQINFNTEKLSYEKEEELLNALADEARDAMYADYPDPNPAQDNDDLHYIECRGG